MDAADHDRCTELFAGRERDTDGASVVDEDPFHAGVRPDLAAERDGRGPDRIGNRPHPALRVSPVDGVAGASDAPDRMVQQDVGAPGLVGARPLPDQPVDHHDRLHLVRFEPAIEQLRETHREQPGRVGDASRAQPPHRPQRPRLREQIAERHRPDVRRDLVQQRAHDLRDAVDPRLVVGKRLGIVRRELRDRSVGPRWVVAVDRDRPPVGERLVVRTERRDPIPMRLQTELLDDEPGHQRHHVRIGGDLDLRVVGERRARVDRPADLVPRLEDDRPCAGLGEVRARHQAVVPAADHDRVIRIGHQMPWSRRTLSASTPRPMEPAASSERKSRSTNAPRTRSSASRTSRADTGNISGSDDSSQP